MLYVQWAYPSAFTLDKSGLWQFVLWDTNGKKIGSILMSAG
jgi:hypothetical protein